MSKIVEAFEKLTEVVKAQFGENALPSQPAIVEEKFMSVKTVDGKVLNLEGEIEVGTPATMVVDGQTVPAPEGEHTLEDGTKILITNGTVAMITPAAAEEAVMGEPKPEEEVDKFSNLESGLASLVSRIEALEAKLTAQATFATKEDFTAVKTVTDEMYNVLKGLVETPAVSPVQKPEQFSAPTNKRKEKLTDLSNILKQL